MFSEFYRVVRWKSTGVTQHVMSFFCYFPILKMEVVCSSERSVDFQRITQPDIAKDKTLLIRTTFLSSIHQCPSFIAKKMCLKEHSCPFHRTTFKFGRRPFQLSISIHFKFVLPYEFTRCRRVIHMASIMQISLITKQKITNAIFLICLL
jgi:hypothetical protein